MVFDTLILGYQRYYSKNPNNKTKPANKTINESPK